MDEMEVNGDAFNFDAEADDPFAIPPPLNDLILQEDPADIAGQEINLQDNKGIEALKNLCSDEHFKGKGHEASDLNKLLHRFEHWAQCLMPRWPFDNVVQKCEVLGSQSRARNELKRIRRNEEEEVLRGEPEDDAEGTAGQADATNDENSTEAASEQDAPQDERPPVELTEEQRERIRRNRVLAFEKRQAKRRRLEEESQTQSQLEDGSTNAEQETNEENSSSEQPSLTNVGSENTAPDETLADMVPDEIHGDTNGNQNDSMDNINDETDLTNIPENDSNVEADLTNIPENDKTDEAGLTNIPENDMTDEADLIDIPENNSNDEPRLTNISENNSNNEAGLANISENDINNEAGLTNIPENDSDVVSHNNVSERDDSSQTSNMNNDHEREPEENDDETSDEDDEILNRSAFDLNPPRPDSSLSVDTNNELNTRKTEVVEDQENNTEMLENDRHETDPNPDNTTAESDINSSSLTTQHVDLPKDPSGTEDTITEEASTEQMDVDNSITE
ncbi:TIMELESS-interacting isoform X1 [Paramuricea clavata]|uniref:TIMELESS-interacting protein n=1 Tax=Paramuricea clavata TaxID=317549 RepID=A0A6S7IQD7_PARCT|nr:TIMELESS-interacting isoform X1 [Paramuricea clavata]